MTVTLRTLLREFEFGTTYAAGERPHSRGVATAPAAGRPGGRATGVAPLAPRQTSAEPRGCRRDGERGGRRRRPRHRAVLRRRPATLPTRPIVLIAGLGQQLHSWPDDFVSDAGGTRLPRDPVRQPGRGPLHPHGLSAAESGGDVPRRDPRRQYHLGDMARDTVGLMDALGYADAHLVGVSMGGMIAQTVAAHHPGRVRTLTSIMSTTGAHAGSAALRCPPGGGC